MRQHKVYPAIVFAPLPRYDVVTTMMGASGGGNLSFLRVTRLMKTPKFYLCLFVADGIDPMFCTRQYCVRGLQGRPPDETKLDNMFPFRWDTIR